VPEFGKYKNVPNIQVLIDFWTKEVELESFRESESQIIVERLNYSETSLSEA
jgi:hypothetical protein